jgi:hypothetical protein
MSREGNPLQIWACKQAVIVLGLIFFWDLSGPDWYVNATIPRYFPITQIDSLKLARSFCQKIHTCTYDETPDYVSNDIIS